MKIRIKLKIQEQLSNILKDQYNATLEDGSYMITQDEFLSDFNYYRKYLKQFAPIEFELQTFVIHYNPLTNFINQKISKHGHDTLIVEAEIVSFIYEVISFTSKSVIVKGKENQIFNIAFPQSNIEIYQFEQ